MNWSHLLRILTDQWSSAVMRLLWLCTREYWSWRGGSCVAVGGILQCLTAVAVSNDGGWAREDDQWAALTSGCLWPNDDYEWWPMLIATKWPEVMQWSCNQREEKLSKWQNWSELKRIAVKFHWAKWNGPMLSRFDQVWPALIRFDQI